MVPVLAIEDLCVTFLEGTGHAPAIDGVSLTVAEGETLCVVGESGCGKSITALSVLGLLPSPPAQVLGGRILFAGRDLLTLPEAALQRIRGGEIAMIFQEPMTSLNPVFTIGNQLIEAVRLHQGLGSRAARREAVDLLGLVGIPAPERRLDEYPHHLSGGMRQRVMIATALAGRPKLLIADEPTTALDVTIQAQILDLLRRLQAEVGMAVMLITHDLGVVAEFARRVVVMYAGRVVEQAEVMDLFHRPLHPYTEALLASVPRTDVRRPRLQVIEGMVPSERDMPDGCRFHPRCVHGRPPCTLAPPPLLALRPRHEAACIRHVDYAPTAAAEGEVAG